MKKALSPALYTFNLFFFFSDSPLQGKLLKFTPPSLKKGANYAFKLLLLPLLSGYKYLET